MSTRKPTTHSSSFRTKGTRRTVQPVSTNPSSYDRQDPFLAFNSLVQLLGALPTRTGTGHLRLSPDEYKLSLHLLNIVEPFIGSAPSRRTLITRQPTEILDAIVFYLDSKQDLLNLALSCQRMHGVVIPRHFDYRVIRCKLSSISVWNHLIVHRDLAKNVRRVEVLDERSTHLESVPSGIAASDTDLESTDDELVMHQKHERYLVAALGKMTAISSFVWNCNHSPISIDDIWPTLLKTDTLQHVEINDNLVFSGPKASLPDQTDDSKVEVTTSHKEKVHWLPCVTSVALRSTRHNYGASKTPAFSRVKTLLDCCPNLQTLDIAYAPNRGYLPADDLFLFGRWPLLTSLTLTNVRPTGGFDAASNFIFAHPNLEVLRLDITNSQRAHISLLPGSLPRLRELDCTKDITTALLECPVETPRPLETIKGIRLSGSHPSNADLDTRFLAALKKHAPQVKRMELLGWNDIHDIARLSDSAPLLTWLDIGKKGLGPSTKAPPIAINTVEWATILSAFPNLTTFHGLKFFYEVSPAIINSNALTSSGSNTIALADRSRIRKNDGVASLLAWKCPKLRRLDHWEIGGGKVIILIRDEQPNKSEKDKEKVRWEVRRIKQVS